MTPNQAKTLLADFLRQNELPFARLSAARRNFSDLARGSALFITVHGWHPSPHWHSVVAFAQRHAFYVEAE